MRIASVQRFDEQLIEIQKAINEAEKGDFISEVEMTARFSRMGAIVSDDMENMDQLD
ncbi:MULTISPECIES: hypothetical protein [Serratia]|jgi:hypothetical protein|uniref:Uncharacterized protein n=1 Tax=Serratia fonticola TaxID=47917 RepID=A0A4U9WG95_SERFO|nr:MULTISPECIES: hypothetical protein [Serratia]MBL5904547.1 hypothetical protein [Serratia fonticola]MDK2376656.1 hypothetical protein [Serratia fonticola]CAI1798204.1 Uncharacterised protein [Serratia fonticola]VTR58002.1 Uncharacterised protein [Serratia fonticola]